MSFKFSSGRLILIINYSITIEKKREKKKNFTQIGSRLKISLLKWCIIERPKSLTRIFLPHLDPNLANEKEKKKKQENESEIRSISQGGEEKRGIDGSIWAKRSKRREPGFKLLRSRLQLDPRRYRLLGTPMQLHNEVVTAIAAINLAVCRRCVCMWTSDVSGKTEYGNACKSCNKSIIYICRSRRA